MLDGYITFSRVTGTVGQKISVTLFLSKIIIPGNPFNGHIPFQKTTNNVILHPTIPLRHFIFSVSVLHNFLCRNFGYNVSSLDHKGNRNIIEFYSSQHGSMFTQFLCQCPRIYTKSPGTCSSFNHCPRLFCEFQ